MKAPGHPSLDFEIKICKNGKVAKVAKLQKLQKAKMPKVAKVAKNAKVQVKATDCKPSAYEASRTPFSRFGWR